MKIFVLLLLISSFYVAMSAAAVNPECQSLADLINALKKRFDDISNFLTFAPGIDLINKKTDLQCTEDPRCNGFNCSGSVYGRYMNFSFMLDYCAKPVTANISAYYAAENVAFFRTIQHSQTFKVADFNAYFRPLNRTIPITLDAKVTMVRVRGAVTVSAFLIPKLQIVIPFPTPPIPVVPSRNISVDTSRCGDEPPMPTKQTTQNSAGPIGGATGQFGAQPLSGGGIAGIVIACLVGVIVVIFAVWYVQKRKLIKHEPFQNTNSEVIA